MNEKIQEFVNTQFQEEISSKKEDTLDILNKNNDSEIPKEDIYSKFEKNRKIWTDSIHSLNSKLKDIKMMESLMVDVYSERQRAVDYYHYLNSILIKIIKNYKRRFMEQYEFYSTKSQLRFPNETLKTNRIQADLAIELENKDVLENHIKFISETIKTIDGIIYAINSRIKLEELMRGA